MSEIRCFTLCVMYMPGFSVVGRSVQISSGRTSRGRVTRNVADKSSGISWHSNLH